MKNNRPALYLIELIFAILFFVITAAVCLQILATATLKSQKAKQLTDSAALMVSMVEQYKANDGNLSLLVGTDGILTNDTLVIYYSKDFIPQGSPDSYQLIIKSTNQQGMMIGEFTLLNGNIVINELLIKEYVGGVSND